MGCGNCATHCVLNESAVKCVHAYAMCGYCDLCTGYFIYSRAKRTDHGCRKPAVSDRCHRSNLCRRPVFRIQHR
ncbi:MAG: hypothetical protein ACYS9H_08680 [Planctomycetota bacterium]